ncbi:MAG: T9SS type A sorting domain-containing protein [Taibaiella sp.]|nr:T9SS type A sorting domain-containing protein [Taibaiella sp.]
MSPGSMTLGGAWVGDKIEQYPDGTYLITNTWNDTVVIKSQADVGESWDFYTDTSAVYYRAEVISKSLELVEGISDSVKTIEIKAFHRDTGFIPSDPSNGLHIGISKNHGLYELFDFLMFPYRLVRDPSYSYPAFPDTTDGWYRHSGPQQFRRVTLREPTKIEMYDYEVGDVLEYRGNCVGPLDGCEQLTIDTCIAKEILSPTSIKFTFSRFIAQRHFGYGPPIPPTFSSTIRTLIADTSKFQVVAAGTFPEERDINTITYYDPSDTSCFTGARIWGSSGTVFNFHEPCGDATAYKVGLGQIHFSHCDDPSGSTLNTYWDLVYSLKRGTACGTFDPVPNRIDNIHADSGFQVVPNPANDRLILTTPSRSDITFQLSDMPGKVISSGHGTSPLQVDVRSVISGNYIITVHDANGTASRKMITVCH